MAISLEQHLLNIERTLSGDAPVDPSLNTAQDRLAWHLNKIEELLADVGTQVGGLSYEVVDTLPATGEPGIVYFVRVSTKKNQNKSDEYLWVNGDFEKIGSTDIDLSSYATKKELTDAIAAIELKEGPKGDAGDSAYQIALNNGFEGTEAEWIASLNGSDGTSVTHSWEGTTLTVTSASGTSSADLKGDKGDPYMLTEEDIANIVSTVLSALPSAEEVSV